MSRGVRRWWPLPALTGLSLVVVALVVSASTAAPGAVDFSRKQLSMSAKFAAYPDIDVGDDGLVAVVFTEGEGTDVKHKGPLKLAWANNDSTSWGTVTVDDNQVFDAAVAVSGSRVHVVWSWPATVIRYTTCDLPDYDCATPEQVTTTSEEALQVDIVVDNAGNPHVVWVEATTVDDTKIRKVYYSRRTGGTWRFKERVQDSNDSEGPSIAYGNGFIHLVWTEWKNSAHTDSQVDYCRRRVTDSNWISCEIPLESWPSWVTEEYLARNLSIAADEDANVYAVWDLVSRDDGGSKRQYAIGYKHSGSNGASWGATAHTYPQGDQFGQREFGAEIFRSGEGDDWVEYVQYLRPHISLAASGTMTVPVLAWHAQVPTGGGEGILAQTNLQIPHKVYWTYATRSGSDGSGYMFWATEFITVSTNLCGEVDMGVESATPRLALVGDVNEVLGGESPGNRLHAAYHETSGDEFWAVFYNNSAPVACENVYLPVIFKDASGGGGGG